MGTCATTASNAGGYIIGVSCTLGVGTHTANFALTVTVPSVFDYAVVWIPTRDVVVVGGCTPPSVVATLSSGSAVPVDCTVSVPSAAGLSASPLTFSTTPAAAPGASTPVTVTTTSATPASPAGGYIIGVSCTLGVGTHTANFALTVTVPVVLDNTSTSLSLSANGCAVGSCSITVTAAVTDTTTASNTPTGTVT